MTASALSSLYITDALSYIFNAGYRNGHVCNMKIDSTFYVCTYFFWYVTLNMNIVLRYSICFLNKFYFSSEIDANKMSDDENLMNEGSDKITENIRSH